MKLQFLEAGEIVTTHGVHGEIKVLPWSDGPDFLLDFDGRIAFVLRLAFTK